MRRRGLLALLAGALVPVAGCGQKPEGAVEPDANGSAGSPTRTAQRDGASGGGSGSAGTPAPTVAAATPPDDDCTGTSPPLPAAVPAEYEGLSVQSYPSRPELSGEAVRSFVREYERAYRTNEIIAAGPGNTGDDVDENPAVTVEAVAVTPTGEGYLARVAVTITFAYEPVTPTGAPPSATPTPIPSAPQFGSAAYYVTDRFLMRQAPAPADEPAVTRGVVLACWGSATNG